MAKIQNNETYEIPHRERVLKQIDRCDRLFSGLDLTPETIDNKIEQYDYTRSAEQGKKIALAVLTLYAESESILPEEFYNHFETKHRQEKAFKETTLTTGRQCYAFLSKDPILQFKGILKIWFFYKELLNALYSLKEFSDIMLKYDRRDLDIFDIDEEDNLFGDQN